jgi:PAS domain S-box-containing protein
MNDQPSILIVDDDEGIRRTLEMILAKKNYQPVAAPDGKTALALAEARAFNLALLDIRLPDTTGTELLAQLKARQPDLEALIVTGHATLETAIQALSRGAYHYFVKPINVDELLATLDQALHKQRLSSENRELLVSLRTELDERQRAEQRVSRLAECFLHFGPDVLENINRLTALCGELLQADCALYNRLDQGLLCSWGQWHTPPGYNPVDKPEGHLCYDVIQSARDQVLVVRDLPVTPYAHTDPNVLPYNLQTYVGRAVKLGDEIVGSLCVVYQRDVEPSAEDHQVMSVIASAIAVEEKRKHAEQAQRAAEMSYRSLFEHVPDAVYRTTPDGQILAANPALVRLLGYSSVEELLAVDIAAVLYADPAARTPIIAQMAHTGEMRNVEVILKRKDGRQVVALDNARSVRDARGNVMYFEGTLTDITERKQRERELLAVAAVSAALRTAPTRSEMLPVILTQTQALLNADAASIVTRDPATGEGVVELGCGIWSGDPEFRVPPGKGVSGRVFETARPYVTNDLPTDPYYYWLDQISYLKALAMVPLIVQSNVVGALTIGRVTPILPEELGILTAIADIAGNALHRAALHEKTEQHLQYLVALRTVDQTISASLDLRFTLNVLLDQIMAQLRVDAADLLLYNPAFQTLDYAAGRGFRNKSSERRLWRLGEGYAGVAALERRAVVVRNLARVVERQPAPAPASEGFVSYVGVPLIAKGRIKGVLEVFHRTPLRADAEWQNFLEMLAGQAVIAIENAQLYEDLQHAHSNLMLSYDATIEGWGRALDLRDEETEEHAHRVVELTEALARGVGVSEGDLIHIRRGALLHDIGKIGVPDHILRKPAALTDEEWVIMRRHPVFALDLLKPISYLHAALDIPYCHHEKWDGTGYPRGLSGEGIPLAARVFALVDVWDALRSERAYRPPWSAGQARDYLRQQTGKHFDPNLVEPFLKIIRD